MSDADSTKSATAQITIASDVAIAVAPPKASVGLGATQPFHATITSAGHPDTSVRWSLTGAACPVACGTVDLAGNYTAPAILPSPTTATLTNGADSCESGNTPLNARPASAPSSTPQTFC